MEELKDVLDKLKPNTYVVLDRNKMIVTEEMLKALDLTFYYVLKTEIKDGKTVIHSDIYVGGC